MEGRKGGGREGRKGGIRGREGGEEGGHKREGGREDITGEWRNGAMYSLIPRPSHSSICRLWY